MGFWNSIKNGFSKMGKGIKHTAQKVGKAIHKGIKWGKKQFDKAKDVPVLGDAIGLAEKYTPLGQIENGVNAVDQLSQGHVGQAIYDAGKAGVPGMAQAEQAYKAGKDLSKGNYKGAIDHGSQAMA